MLILLNLLQPIQKPVVPNYEDPNVLQKYITPDAVAPVVAAPAAQVQATAPVTPAFDPNAVLGGLMAQAPKAPVYSMTDEATLRKMAKGQKVGDLLSLLSDTFGVVKGAPVAARQFTSTAPYLQKILDNRREYQAKLDDYQNKDFARKIQMATKAAEQARADAAAKQRAYQFEKTQGLAEDKAKTDAAYKEYLKEQKLKDSAFNREKFDETKRATGVREKQNAARISKMGSTAADKANQPKKVKTEKQTYQLKPEEYSYYRGLAINSPEVHKTHPEWFVQVAGKRGKVSYKLDPEVKDDDLVRGYLETQENPQGVAPVQQSGLQPMIPSVSPLDPGYGSVGGHKKQPNAATGGLY